jgi:hypothetical protein
MREECVRTDPLVVREGVLQLFQVLERGDTIINQLLRSNRTKSRDLRVRACVRACAVVRVRS